MLLEFVGVPNKVGRLLVNAGACPHRIPRDNLHQFEIPAWACNRRDPDEEESPPYAGKSRSLLYPESVAFWVLAGRVLPWSRRLTHVRVPDLPGQGFPIPTCRSEGIGGVLPSLEDVDQIDFVCVFQS